MNHSADKPIPANGAESEELLGQFEAVLYRLARVMNAQPDQGSGALTPPQYLILRLLHMTGPMRISDVAAHMGVKNPAASMMLHAMFEHDLVTREEDPDDRRATLVSVSKAGEKALHAAEENRRAFFRRVTQKLDPGEWATVIKGLNELADAASAELGVTGVGAEDSEDAIDSDA